MAFKQCVVSDTKTSEKVNCRSFLVESALPGTATITGLKLPTYLEVRRHSNPSELDTYNYRLPTFRIRSMVNC